MEYFYEEFFDVESGYSDFDTYQPKDMYYNYNLKGMEPLLEDYSIYGEYDPINRGDYQAQVEENQAEFRELYKKHESDIKKGNVATYNRELSELQQKISSPVNFLNLKDDASSSLGALAKFMTKAGSGLEGYSGVPRPGTTSARSLPPSTVSGRLNPTQVAVGEFPDKPNRFSVDVRNNVVDVRPTVSLGQPATARRFTPPPIPSKLALSTKLDKYIKAQKV